MANKTLASSRLQLIFSVDAEGTTKSMSFSRIRLDATPDQYYNAALALGDLCAHPLQGVRLVETNQLTD